MEVLVRLQVDNLCTVRHLWVFSVACQFAEQFQAEWHLGENVQRLTRGRIRRIVRLLIDMDTNLVSMLSFR